MAITFGCPCGKRFQVREEMGGKRAKCPACGRVLEVPISAQAVDSLPELEPLSSLPPSLPASPLRQLNEPQGTGSTLILIVADAAAGAVLMLSLVLGGLAFMRWPCAPVADSSSPVQTDQATATPSSAFAAPMPRSVARSPEQAAGSPPPPPPIGGDSPDARSVWNVHANAPSTAPQWRNRLDVSIPVKMGSHANRFPATPSPIVVVSRGTSASDGVVAWNLLTQEKVGKPASLAQKTGQDLAVSPDGKDVASRITVAKHSSTVRVWSLETGKAVRDIACDEPLIHVSGCEFADANRTARDARFRQLLYVLWSVPIPYYIPQDADLSQLPGVTRIE